MSLFTSTGPRGRHVMPSCYRRSENDESLVLLSANALLVRGPSSVKVASRSSPLELDGLIRLMTRL